MQQEASLKSQIYDLDKTYSRALELLAKDKAISPANREIIRSFAQDKLALGFTKSRAIIVIHHLRRLAKLTSAPFSDFEEKDIKDLMASLEMATFNVIGNQNMTKKPMTKAYSDNTKNVTKSIFKNLLRNLGKSEKWFKWVTAKKATQKIRSETLLTSQDYAAMLEATQNLQWKALLALFFETGCRPGEILGLRIKDVAANSNKAKIYVNGKTGARILYAYQSYGLIKQWLAQSPLRQDSNNPLWFDREQRPIKLTTFCSYYRKLATMAGLPPEKGYPYVSRHSKLTSFYKDFGAVLGASLSGHVPGSKQIRTYLHLSEKDIENALDQHNGLKAVEETTEPSKCVACGMINRFDELACQNPHCGEPLSSAKAVVIEHSKEFQEFQQAKATLEDPQIKTLLELWKKPEVMEKMIALLKEAVKS